MNQKVNTRITHILIGPRFRRIFSKLTGFDESTGAATVTPFGACLLTGR